MVSALLRVKKIKLFLWYDKIVHNSKIARGRNSGSQFQSSLYNFCQGSCFLSAIMSVRNSGVSARRELTVFKFQEMNFIPSWDWVIKMLALSYL